MPPPLLIVGGISFSRWGACVRDHQLFVHMVPYKPLAGFHQIYNFEAVGRKMNWLDVEFKRSKVKVTPRQNALFWHESWHMDRRFIVEDRPVIYDISPYVQYHARMDLHANFGAAICGNR